MTELIREEPPQARTPARNWAAVVLKIAEEAPDEWVLAARDVPASSATHLKRTFHVEAQVTGVDSKTHRADKVFVKFVTGQSTLTERGERIRDTRNKARAVREKLAAAKGKKP